MATMTLSTPAAGNSMLGMFKALFAAFAAGLNASQTYETLSAMSDKQLQARGLTREEIPAYVARLL